MGQKKKRKNDDVREIINPEEEEEEGKDEEWKGKEFEFDQMAFEELDGDSYEVVNGVLKFKKKKNNKRPLEDDDHENQEEEDKDSKAIIHEKERKKKKKKIKMEKPKVDELQQEKKEQQQQLVKRIEIDQSWEELGVSSILRDGISVLGYKTPTPIQLSSLRLSIKSGRDILGAAETGSGKTLAYGIPILNVLLATKGNKREGPLALILTPTRELALQVLKHLKALVDASKQVHDFQVPKLVALVGGLSEQKQVRQLSEHPEVLIATPGRLWALVQDEHIKSFGNLRFLVFDEADRMVDQGHFPEIRPILSKILQDERQNISTIDVNQRRQTMLFSATLLLDQQQYKAKNNNKGNKQNASPLMELMKTVGLRGSPSVCSITSEEKKNMNAITTTTTKDSGQVHQQQKLKLPDNLDIAKLECAKEDDKDAYLYYFLSQHDGRALIFVNTISALRRVTEVIRMLMAPLISTRPVSSIHAQMQQRQRLKHLEKFRDTPGAILVATDVAARGLDIPSVNYVIHHGIPSNPQTFVHRSGRTARALSAGISLALVGAADMKTFRIMTQQLAESTGDSTLVSLPSFPVNNSILMEVRTRISLARRIQQIESRRASVRNDENWITKNAREAGLEVDTDYGTIGRQRRLDDDDVQDQDAQEKRELVRLKNNLASRLSQPMLPRGTSNKKQMLLNQAKKRLPTRSLLTSTTTTTSL